MDIHLFCQPGINDIRFIVEVSQPYLELADHPLVAYVPAASTGYNWADYTEKAFDGIAEVATLDLDHDPRQTIDDVLERATTIYIPGGNTYLLNHRLYNSGAARSIAARVRKGIPLVGFSAGAVICGENILTTNDLNAVGTPHFSGFNFTNFNFNVHYPSQPGLARDERDDNIWEYQVFHDNPVLAMEDDVYLRIDEMGLLLVRGSIWRFDKSKERQHIPPGRINP